MSSDTRPIASPRPSLLHFTRLVAVEYGKFGIRSNAVAPGTVKTQAWEARAAANPNVFEEARRWYPLQRVVDPKDVANAVGFLAGPQATAITGVCLPVDCGLTAKPGRARANLLAIGTLLKPRAVQLFMEAQNRSNFLFLRNSGRKTASHFSWNCSRGRREEQVVKLNLLLTDDRMSRLFPDVFRTPAIRASMIAIFTFGMAGAMTAPYRSVVGIRELGLSDGLYSFLSFVSAAVNVVISILLGNLADRLGEYRSTMIGACLFGIVGYGMVYAFPTAVVFVISGLLPLPIYGALNSLLFANARAAMHGMNRSDMVTANSGVRAMISLSWVLIPGITGLLLSGASSMLLKPTSLPASHACSARASSSSPCRSARERRWRRLIISAISARFAKWFLRASRRIFAGWRSSPARCISMTPFCH